MGHSLGRLGMGVLAVVLGAGHAVTATTNDTRHRVVLGGTSILQRDLSEPPKPPQRGRVTSGGDPSPGFGGGGRGGGPPGGGPPGGMGGGPGGPGGGGGGISPPKPPTEEEIARMRAVVMQAVDPAAKIVIGQTDTDVTIMLGNANGETFTTDGKKRTHESTLGPIEQKARWKGDRLVIETKTTDGLKTTRTFWIDPASPTRALVITIKVEGGKLLAAAEARYVYHAAQM